MRAALFAKKSVGSWTLCFGLAVCLLFAVWLSPAQAATTTNYELEKVISMIIMILTIHWLFQAAILAAL